jgi:hypothetical protein
MPETTLARKLGIASHLSMLYKKAVNIGIPHPEDWIALAVQRGCQHYKNDRNVPPISTALLSNEELSALLLSAANPYRPLLIRVAAQLLSSPAIDTTKLARLCQLENGLMALAWIAQAGSDTEPTNPFWQNLSTQILQLNKKGFRFPTGVFPHPSRFRIETGFQRFSHNKTILKQWLRPIESR